TADKPWTARSGAHAPDRDPRPEQGVRPRRGPGDRLAGVSLDIAEGEFVALIGPSGSGKSTLMNTLGCLDRPTFGSYRLAGDEVAGLSPDQLARLRNRRIGFVFQNFNLLSRTTALENVEAALLYNPDCPRHERRKRATAILQRVGLG